MTYYIKGFALSLLVSFIACWAVDSRYLTLDKPEKGLQDGKESKEPVQASDFDFYEYQFDGLVNGHLKDFNKTLTKGSENISGSGWKSITHEERVAYLARIIDAARKDLDEKQWKHFVAVAKESLKQELRTGFIDKRLNDAVLPLLLTVKPEPRPVETVSAKDLAKAIQQKDVKKVIDILTKYPDLLSQLDSYIVFRNL